MLEAGGIQSLLFTSDNPVSNKDYGTTDGGMKMYMNFCRIELEKSFSVING